LLSFLDPHWQLGAKAAGVTLLTRYWRKVVEPNIEQRQRHHGNAFDGAGVETNSSGSAKDEATKIYSIYHALKFANNINSFFNILSIKGSYYITDGHYFHRGAYIKKTKVISRQILGLV